MIQSENKFEFDLPQPSFLTDNFQGTEDSVNYAGMDRVISDIAPLGFSGGGGIPSGFVEETFDVVNNDNTPGVRIFLTKLP